MLLLQLGAGWAAALAPPPAWKVVNVRARGAHGRCAIEGRSRCDRSVVRVDTPYESALTRCASSNHAGRRGHASAGHAGELVACLCVLYSVRIAR